MRKRILFIGYNFAPEPTGIGKYSGEMIHWLAQNGYDCTVVTTYPYYPYWKVQEPYTKHRFRYTKESTSFASGGSITLYRCPMYVPAAPSGIKRMLLDLSFFLSSLWKLLQLLPAKRYDYVITVIPSIVLGFLGILFKKVHGAKFLCHVQDLQIEAARDLGLIRSARIINFLFRLEKFIFDKTDLITSVGEGMVRKIQQKTRRNIILFPNWTDVRQFFPVSDRQKLKKAFGFAPHDKIILYSGAIGEKQGLESILHAATEFKENSDVKFIICGSGPYRDKLQQLAEELHLRNVIFYPLQPVEKFNQFLNIADLHLVIQKASASDLVMPSKLTTVLAVGGLALITANKGSGLYSLIEQNQMGLLVEAENQKALTEGIRKAIAESNYELVKNARLYAEKYLSIENIMSTYEKGILQEN